MVADCSRKTLDIFQKYRKIKFEMKKREISKHKNIQKWIELKIHVPSKFLSLFVFYGFCFIFFMISLFFFCSAVYCSMGSAELVKKTNFPGKIFFSFSFTFLVSNLILEQMPTVMWVDGFLDRLNLLFFNTFPFRHLSFIPDKI